MKRSRFQEIGTLQTVALSILICLTFLRAHGQSIPYKLYSIHDGLPQSQINNIIQDSRGYIWVGTQDGLAYYDGLKFVNITLRNNLPNNYIHCIAEDQNKQIIVNIGKWLVKYDGQKFKIDTLQSLMHDHSFVIDSRMNLGL